MLLKQPEFKPAEIEDDLLHKRIAHAVHDKMIKSFYMRESSRDGDQDLTMSMREVEEVVSGSMGDSGIKGHQHYTTNSRQSLTMQTGNGCGGGNAVVAFQIGQIRYCIYHG